MARLLADERATSFPRVAALCHGPGDPTADVLREAGDAASPADAALDAVATSTLLRSREAAPARIAAELKRPDFPTTRLVFGLAMMALIDKQDDMAAALLGAILQDGRPHPEARMSLARIAGRAGRIAAAREQLRLARSDLEAAARTTPLRLALAEAEIELMHGDLEKCRAVLTVAGRTWPNRPELTLIDSHLAVLAGDTERALSLSRTACADSRLPWTWRRAMAHYLALRAQGIDMAHYLTQRAQGVDVQPPSAAAIRTDATLLRTRARAAFDSHHEARAENILAYMALDPELYLAGLERVLELEPGDPTASAQFIEQVYSLLVDAMPLAGRFTERAARAVRFAHAIVARRRIEPRCLTRQQFVMSTLYGADLAARLGERDSARQLGAVVQIALQQHPDQTLQEFLDGLRTELGIDSWDG